MKRFGFLLVPILVILLGSTLVPRLLAGGMNPTLLLGIGFVLVMLMTLVRPKKAATKTPQQVEDEILDDYCKDAFAGDAALEKKFASAMNDIGNNLPKSAASKLQKLSAACTTDPQRYAVALASAMAYRLTQDWKNVIREYNKAIVLHATGKLAYQIGDCHQRLGNLDKAMDSYEFAMELDPENPQYPSSMGTACVGDGNYEAAIHHAQDALDLDENFAQALATMAICYGLKDDALMYKHYLDRAVDEGYSQDKIESTVKALKKRDKR